MIGRLLIAICISVVLLDLGQCDVYDDNVQFNVYKANSGSFYWNLGTDLTTQGCDVNGKFAFVIHGFQNSKGPLSVWKEELAQKLLQYRGGCVIVVTWGKYSDILNYLEIVWVHFNKVSAVITRRLKSLETAGVSPDNMFLFGHSLGARLAVDAGINFGKGKIAQVDACDPAGPGFSLDIVSTDAAKNVQCIHTSSTFGTFARKCHQDWLMGYCGVLQPAANPGLFAACVLGICPASFEGTISHNLCNNFYINAFETNFVSNDIYNCPGANKTASLPANFKMGYMEDRRSASIKAIISSPTNFKSPYAGL